MVDARRAESIFTGWVGERFLLGHPADMARNPRIPLELTKRPFSLRGARAAGLTLSSLRGSAWQRIGSELYRWTGMREDAWLSLSAWQRVLPAESIFCGATAACVCGLDLEPTDPVEVVCPPRSGIRPRSGLRVRRCELAAIETVTVRGLLITTLHRTLLDLCAQRTAVDALVALDMAVHLGLTDRTALAGYGESAKGRAGARRL